MATFSAHLTIPLLAIDWSPTAHNRPSISSFQYNRQALKPGIVHICVGNFFRAHGAFLSRDARFRTVFDASRDRLHLEGAQAAMAFAAAAEHSDARNLPR